MYVERVRLRDIACFEDLSLDFTRQGKPCQWVVILGENGCGKSTLLQMIALSLVGSEMVREIAGGVDWTRFARSPTSAGRIDVELLPTRADPIGMPPPRIFLSYAEPDRETVRELYEKLAAAGMRPWMGFEDILPGENWKTSIDKEIRQSDLILIFLSRASQDRGPHQFEYREAINIWQEIPKGDIFIIPVRLEDHRRLWLVVAIETAAKAFQFAVRQGCRKEERESFVPGSKTCCRKTHSLRSRRQAR